MFEYIDLTVQGSLDSSMKKAAALRGQSGADYSIGQLERDLERVDP
jgi:hypothetical protein